MFENNPLIQVIISLIILLLMGYIGYNIYLIELQNMFKGESDIRKEVSLLSGVYDFNNSEAKYNTYDKTQLNFKDVKPSINQEGGAEYSYNFWLFTDHDKLKPKNGNDKDTILFLKGEKYLYYNDKLNYNCSTSNGNSKTILVLTKNPLVRLGADGKSIAVEYNNVYNADSYKQGSVYKRCGKLKNTDGWKSKNNNMLGIYDIDFNNKWFMVTIIMKEVADSNNIISVNRASCKIYINGSKLFDKKVETKYNNDLVSATLKNNNSPFYINPDVSKSVNDKGIDGPYNKITEENTLKIADIKYYNYAISEDMISSLYNKGFNTEIAITTTIDNKLSKYNMVSVDDMEDNEIKAL
jgi:hypothetical protein